MEALGRAASTSRIPLSSRHTPQAELRAAGCSRRNAARRGGSHTVCSSNQPDSLYKMTDGVLHQVHSPDDQEEERKRLESVDAFAELVKMSSKAPPGPKKDKPKPIGIPEGLSKPPWLRQRAPQGDRCAHWATAYFQGS